MLLKVQDIVALPHGGVHNFAAGVLNAYFRLGEMIWKGAATLHNGRILQLAGVVKKTYVYKYDEADLPFLNKAQKQGPVYSLTPLPLPKGGEFKEIAYDLKQVFDPKSYPNAKKRHQRIRYPFSWLKKQGIICDSADLSWMLPGIKLLHDAWVERKLADPDTFRQMFPGSRYIRCVEAAKAPQVLPYRCFVAFKRNDKGNADILACRVFAIDEAWAFDLAFFSDTWTPSRSQLAEYFNVWCLSTLQKSGIEKINCGACLNVALSAFKEHLPSFPVKSYSYSRLS